MNGKVMLAQEYATAICKSLGIPLSTEGTKFGQDAVPKVIAYLIPGQTENDIRKIMDGGTVDTNYDASLIQTSTGLDTGKDTNIDNSITTTNKLKQVVAYYKPIIVAAALNGWKC